MRTKYFPPQEWSLVFGSYSPVLDSSAPLWFATYNDVKVRTLLVGHAERIKICCYLSRSRWELLSEGKCCDTLLIHRDV